MAQILERVNEGDEVTITKINDRGHLVGRPPLHLTVTSKCAHNSGNWVCATHKMTFSNQFCKDTHIEKGTHTLGWFCNECNNLQVP